ncbi:T9SS type A sorting domain-containing protein [Flavobacterium sp. SUN052]|uniref:T9SS type A sorting domain-containing protein n=1 Tax=Flavobacterium sp. SUN052 TaxID=3002441 RepID=UPI00237E9153|nr:T9SS type A sorting domain-containing protein [Flavobacterium sp. SUN052]MEC4004801.1 T9SS type A sorting domain-containing protein [Flavobacterium sp. SUN052]
MTKKILYNLAVLLFSTLSFGQITTLPANESFTTPFTEGTNVSFIPNWTGNTVAPPSSKIFRDIVDYNSTPAALSVIPTSSFNGDVQVNLNLSTYSSVGISFLAKSMLNGTGTRDAVLTMSTSIDNGVTWIGSSIVASLPNINQTAFTSYSYTLPVEANNQSNVLVRFFITRGSAGTSTAAKMVIDDVLIQQVTTPSITVSSNSLTFSQVLGSPSQSQTFNISGSNLTGNLILTAPTNFEVSLNSTSGFSGSLSLVPNSGNILLTPIYSRLNSSSVGTYSGNLMVTSQNATTQNIALSGDCVVSTVTNPSPLSISDANIYNVFTNWASTNTAGSFPSNIAFWTHATTDPDLATLFISDWSCLYNLTSRSRFVGDDANGISMINTGNSQFTGVCDGTDPAQTTGTTISNGRAGAIVLALNSSAVTSGSSITINWTGRTVLKNLRAYGLRMQYRIGLASGNPNSGWQEFSSTQEYLNGEDATFESKSTTLPTSCNGQPIVQVRWVYYVIGTTGARAQVGLDDVIVSVATLNNDSFIAETNTFSLYPNPSNKEIVNLNKINTVTIYDITGRKIANYKEVNSFDTKTLQSGTYLVKTDSGLTQKLIVK